MTLCIFASSASYGAHYRFVTLEFPPLAYIDKDGKPGGAAVEIVRKVMSRLGHTIDLSVYPWERSLSMVKEGKADAIFTAYRNSDREKFIDYSALVLVDQIVSFYVNKQSGLTYNGDLTKLKGRSIGILNTVSYGKDFDLAKTQIPLNTQRVEKLDSNFKKLSLGRIDYVVSNRHSAKVIIDRLRISKQVSELPHPVEVIPSYIGFSKTRNLRKLRDRFDQELSKLKANGTYKKVLNSYGVRIPKGLAKRNTP